MLDLRALLLTQVDVIELVLFNLVGVLNNFKTFMSKQTEGTRDEADRVVNIITVATQRLVSSGRGIHLYPERQALGAQVIFAIDLRAFTMVMLCIGLIIGMGTR